jgi:hypothetical protein
VDDDMGRDVDDHNMRVADSWAEGYGTADAPPRYAAVDHSHTITIEDQPGDLLVAEPPPLAATLRYLGVIAAALFVVLEVVALAVIVASYLNGWRP